MLLAGKNPLSQVDARFPSGHMESSAGCCSRYFAQAMQVPAATWMSVMSQSSTNSAIVIWCIAAAVYERSHTQ